MKVDIVDTRKRVTFWDLKLGEIFTTDTGGLYIKVEFKKAFVLGGKPVGGVPAGTYSGWTDDDVVIPAKSVQVTI